MSPTAPGAAPAELRALELAGYGPGPWPAEDGGPARGQAPRGTGGLGLRPGEALAVTAARQAFGAVMVLRRGDEVLLVRAVLGRRPQRDPCRVRVERLDPASLAVERASPVLPAGPFWPGGAAVLADGDVLVVFGDHVHRLDGDTLAVRRSRRLPVARPHNSFVVLADGTPVVKDLDRDERAPSTVRALDPETLADRDVLRLPEAAVARLSGRGDAVYAVGATRVHRVLWDAARGRLRRDEAWSPAYRDGAGRGHGWDPVLAGGRVWFLDQGRHRFRVSMRGAALDRGPVRLHAVDEDDARDHATVDVCGLPWGAVTNPPLVDAERGIAVGFDSANGRIAAFAAMRGTPLRPLWAHPLGTAGHLLRFPDTGELVAYDRPAGPLGTRAGARLLDAAGERGAVLARRPRTAAAAGRRGGEDLVVLDLATGAERARARVPSPAQSVTFPAPGPARSVLYTSLTTVARVGVVRA